MPFQPSCRARLQGTLLAIMNVAVLVLPVVQLWVSTHKVLSSVGIKALASIRSRLRYSSQAHQDPTELEGNAQVSSHGIAVCLGCTCA